MTESRTGVAHSHASDTFLDTDGGGLEAGDALAIHEEDVEAEGFVGEDEGADVGLDLTAHASSAPDLLEGLLQQSVSPAQAKGSDFSLDDLLTESLETIAESAAVKANRKKLKDTRLTKAEREAIEAKIRGWELAREWTPKASVAMFHLQKCYCGSVHSIFSGMFQRQSHRVSAIERWVPANDIADTGLPKEHKAHMTAVAVCIDCADSQGFGDCAHMHHTHISHIINPLKAH